jgi:hypothetical protein
MRFSTLLASAVLVVVTAANPVIIGPRSQSFSPRTILAMQQAGCVCSPRVTPCNITNYHRIVVRARVPLRARRVVRMAHV